LKCNNIHGFISVSESDTIKNLPSNYGYNPDRPIYWYHSGKKSLKMLASDWRSMLSGKIIFSKTMEQESVLTSGQVQQPMVRWDVIRGSVVRDG